MGILVNHFPMRVTVKTVHRYDVKVESPDWPKGPCTYNVLNISRSYDRHLTPFFSAFGN